MEAESVAAVVTICTQRKRLKAVATPAAIANGDQVAVSQSWRDALAKAPAETPTRNLYAGRSFSLAKTAAELSGSPLYVVSAGLGLVSGDTAAPAYGLTVSHGHADSISTKVTRNFDVATWFADLLQGPYSTSWSRVADAEAGRVLVALTRPYAEMVGDSLSELTPEALGRLRIFGTGLHSALPSSLRPLIIPYDDRLDALLPGTRSDFAQRAMLHFVRCIAPLPVDRDGDFAAVAAELARFEAPARPTRPQRTDDQIIHLIVDRLGPGASASRLLRRLRDEDGIACEQKRFARLFRTAVANADAA